MSYHISSLDNVSDIVRPGDVIAFGGNGVVSELVKLACNSHVSHVGCVLSLNPIRIIESTSLDGITGVTVNLLTRRLDYDGRVWLLPLSDDIHRELNKTAFFDFLMKQDHKPYDLTGAVLSVFKVEGIADPDEKYFCSELVAAALEAGGLSITNRPDFVKPSDLCAMHIFSGEYYQLVGSPQIIDEYVII